MATKNSRASKTRYQCTECGHELAKWVGQCPRCREWNSVDEIAPIARTAALSQLAPAAPSVPAKPIAEVDLDSARAIPTGIGELDRVLGGGIVPGAVMLLAGEPGVGKSTLLLESAYRWALNSAASNSAESSTPRPSGSSAARRGTSLYITGEESAGQVRLRAERTNCVHSGLYLSAESDLSAVIGQIDAVQPGLVIVDSVQTIQSSEVDGSPGNVTQVRAVTTALVALAKERGIPVLLVGHVTKEGTVAGPRALEHLVDVVLQFEGDRHSSLRLLRGVKNRFGPADEIGCFEQRDDGINEVTDPSGLFLNEQREQVPGTAVTVMVEGKRPLLAEVQALVTSSQLAMPRRAVSGLDSARVSMMLAVLAQRGRIRTGDQDVHAATVGGMKVTEPAADLALCLAIASARTNVALPADLIAIGEVGLAGEIRRVTGLGRRLEEAARLGFRHALVPPDAGKAPAGMETTVVRDLRSALRTLREHASTAESTVGQ